MMVNGARLSEDYAFCAACPDPAFPDRNAARPEDSRLVGAFVDRASDGHRILIAPGEVVQADMCARTGSETVDRVIC
jgi:hypothetical protein